jgi:antirestriction protein
MNQERQPERPEAVAEPEHKETDRDDEPRIYVASLSDYNAGRLHGAWINANQDTEDIEEDIQQMLSKSKEPIAEEWAIHDYEGFGPLRISEYESIDNVSEIARGIAEHGMAFAHWADYLEASEWQYLNRFEDCYIGHWSSAVEFAESMLEDMGIDIDSLVDEQFQPYVTFDLEAFARDLSFDYRVAEGSDGVYVFDNT